MTEDLFDDGWRDPGDDFERAGVYFYMALGFIFGPLMLWLSYTMFFGQRVANSVHIVDIVLGILALATGIAVPIGCFLFFRHEAKYWQLKKMTADRVVAGGMLTGLGVFFVALEFMSRGTTAGGNSIYGLLAMFLLGAVIFLLFLLIGLVYAFWPKPTRVWKNVAIISRYVLDDKLQEIPDAVGPFDEGWVPVIVLKTSEGEQRKLRASEDAYEMAYQGAVGTASVKERRMVKFSPRLKDPAWRRASES